MAKISLPFRARLSPVRPVIRPIFTWTAVLVAVLAGLILPGCNPAAPDEKSSEATARRFLQNAPTFKFDGITSSLKLAGATSRTGGWEFEYRFDSAQAGYGDRTGQMLAQVITPHAARITVIQSKVTSAVLDGKWDEMAQKMLP